MTALAPPPAPPGRDEPAPGPGGSEAPGTAGAAGAPPGPLPGAPAAAVVGVLLALLAVLTGLTLSSAPMSVGTLDEGSLERFVGGAWQPVVVGETVPFGARVRVRVGQARVVVEGGTLELGGGAQARLGDATVELDRGSLLVARDRAQRVVVDGQRLVGRGTFRVDRGVDARVAVYAGGAALEGAGGTDGGGTDVPRLRERPLVGDGVGAAAPLSYVGTDPWDARLLADALAVDELAVALERQLVVEYGEAPRPDAFYADFTVLGGDLPAALDVLEARRGEAGADRAPGAVLLAALVAETVSRGAALPPLEAVTRVDELRAAGAAWGLVLVDADLDAGDLRATADAALRRREAVVEERGGEGPAAPLPVPAPPSDPTPTPDPGDPAPPNPPDDGSGPTDPPGPPSDDGPTQPLDDAVDDVLDDAGDLLDDLVGDDPVTGPVGEAVDDATDLLDDVLDP